MKILRLVEGVQTEVEVPNDYQLQENESLVTTPRTEPAQPNNDVLNAYQQQLLAESRRNAILEQRLREVEERTKTPERTPTPEEEKQFFDAPRTATRDIVRDEINRSVAPLNDFIFQQQRANLITSLKAQMKNLPNQFPYIGQVESYVDQLIANAPQITPEIVASAYNQAVGYAFSQGQLTTSQPNNPPAPPNVPSVPPQIRTNAPPPRHNERPANVRQLNENEKKIARFNNMSDAEYIAWTEDVRPSEVAHVTDDVIKTRGGSR